MASSTIVLTVILSVLSVVFALPGSDWAYDRPRRARPAKSQIIVVGGKRDAGSAYRYRNGFDKTNALGARKYEHNAGYGFADEIDNTNPNPQLTEWGRKYATAQSSTWGEVVPRVWRVPAQNSNLGSFSLSSGSGKNYNNGPWSAEKQRTVFAAPKWVNEKLRGSYKTRRNKRPRKLYNLYNNVQPRTQELEIQEEDGSEEN